MIQDSHTSDLRPWKFEFSNSHQTFSLPLRGRPCVRLPDPWSGYFRGLTGGDLGDGYSASDSVSGPFLSLRASRYDIILPFSL